VRSFSRCLALFSIVASLVACGGGGGGGTIPSGPAATATPNASLAQQSVQRGDAQATLSGVQTYEELEGSGSAGVLASVRTARAMLAKTHARALLASRHIAATCESGEEETISGDTITVEEFYDSGCTEPEATIVWTASQDGYDLTGPATFTTYSTSGAVTETAQMTITFYYNSADVLTGIALLFSSIVENGVQLGQLGVACTESSTNATSCGLASVSNVGALNVEDGASVTATVSSSEAVSMQIAEYQGAQNTLSISQGTLPSWTISPASDQTASYSLSGQPSGSGFTLTLTDVTNGGTFAVTGSAGGTITGTLTSNASGATEASFTVNALGSGTLTYGSGTQVTITDFVVQG
jgi:hypothetical protein